MTGRCDGPTADAAVELFPAWSLLRLCLQFAQVIVEPVETLFPEAAIALEPIVDFLQRARLDPARPPLRLASARDQAGTLEHLEVLGNRRQTHIEGLGEFRHRRLA